MKRSFTPLFFAPTILTATIAHADLSKLPDNVYAYLGSTDASPARSFAVHAGNVTGQGGVPAVAASSRADGGLQRQEPLRQGYK